MANCCILGRNRPLLISVGLIGGLVVVTFLLAWVAWQMVALAAVAPAAIASHRARALGMRRIRTLAVTLAVSREKLGGVLDTLAPRTRCRVSSALLRYDAGAAGFVYRHFVGLTAALLVICAGASYALIRALAS